MGTLYIVFSRLTPAQFDRYISSNVWCALQPYGNILGSNGLKESY
jgi:hypothetical protein